MRQGPPQTLFPAQQSSPDTASVSMGNFLVAPPADIEGQVRTSTSRSRVYGRAYANAHTHILAVGVFSAVLLALSEGSQSPCNVVYMKTAPWPVPHVLAQAHNQQTCWGDYAKPAALFSAAALQLSNGMSAITY